MDSRLSFGTGVIAGLASIVLFEVGMINGMRRTDAELKQNSHYIKAQFLDDVSTRLNYARTKLKSEKDIKELIGKVVVELGDGGVY